MNISDTLTIGLVLILLFGSIALYLYTRIQQSEQKINLLESILLDLKMSNEFTAYTELPANTMDHTESEHPTSNQASYAPFHDLEEVVDNTDCDVKKEDNKAKEDLNKTIVLNNENAANTVNSVNVANASNASNAVNSANASNNENNVDFLLDSYESLDDADVSLDASMNKTELQEVKNNYDSMSLKELQSLAKSRGIVGVPIKKSAFVDALKASDMASVTLGSPGSLGVGSNSFIETSASFSNES